MECDVIRSADDGVQRIRLAGRLDTAGAAAVETRFAAAIAAGKGPAVVDLRDVEFIASMGIRMLMTSARAARQRDAAVALFGARPLVQEVLATSGVDVLVPVVADEAAALAAVRA